MQKNSKSIRYGRLQQAENGTFIAYPDLEDNFRNETPIAYGEETDVDDI